MSRERKWTDEQFIEASKISFSVASVLKGLGLSPTGGNYGTVKNTIKRLGISTSHWTGQGHLRGKRCPWVKKMILKDVLVCESIISRRSLKKRLLQEGLLINQCSECGQFQEWNAKPLNMVLDHINGVNNDNRIENLRMLCPNCNSQQETFAGRNNKGKVYVVAKKYNCVTCGKKLAAKSKSGKCICCVRKKDVCLTNKCLHCGVDITKKSKSGMCSLCVSLKNRRVNRPPPDILLSEIQDLGYSAVGRKYGVSDNAIRKWEKSIGSSRAVVSL